MHIIALGVLVLAACVTQPDDGSDLGKQDEPCDARSLSTTHRHRPGPPRSARSARAAPPDFHPPPPRRASARTNRAETVDGTAAGYQVPRSVAAVGRIVG